MGSLTKAGRVRHTTPKVPKTSKRTSPGPRVKNRRKYINSLKPKRDWRRRRRR